MGTTDVVPNAQSAFHTLSLQFGAFFGDFVSFIVIFFAVLFFALYFGRDRIAPLIAALYAALALYVAFPYMAPLGGNPYLEIGVYVIMAVLGFMTFSGLSYFMAAHSGGIFSEVVISILVAGFILAISLHTLPVKDVYTFSAATQALFASPQAFFWWLVAPLAGLFFLGR